jgi:hypothetical protein
MRSRLEEVIFGLLAQYIPGVGPGIILVGHDLSQVTGTVLVDPVREHKGSII